MAKKTQLNQDRIAAIGVLAGVLTIVLAFIPSKLIELGIKSDFIPLFVGVSYIFALALFVAVYFAAYTMRTDIEEKDRKRALKIFEFIYNKSIVFYGVIMLVLLPFGIGPSLSQFLTPQSLGILLVLLVLIVVYYVASRGGKK